MLASQKQPKLGGPVGVKASGYAGPLTFVPHAGYMVMGPKKGTIPSEILPKPLQSIEHAITAPAAKALDLSLRPSYAIGAGVHALATGKNLGHEMSRGFMGGRRNAWLNVAHDVGLKGTVAHLAALGGSIAFDPVTYGTGGLGHAGAEAGAHVAQPGRLATAIESGTHVRPVGGGAAKPTALRQLEQKAARRRIVKSRPGGPTVKTVRHPARPKAPIHEPALQPVVHPHVRLVPKGPKFRAGRSPRNPLNRVFGSLKAQQKGQVFRDSHGRLWKPKVDKAGRPTGELRLAHGVRPKKVGHGARPAVMKEIQSDLRPNETLLAAGKRLRGGSGIPSVVGRPRGIQIGLRGKIPLTHIGGEIKTSGRLTSAIAQKVSRSRVAAGPVGRAAKSVQHGTAETFFPGATPVGVPHEAHQVARQAVHEFRSGEAMAQHGIADKFVAYNKVIDGSKVKLGRLPEPKPSEVGHSQAIEGYLRNKNRHMAVAYAIEHRVPHLLPHPLDNVAKNLRDEFKGMAQAEIALGIRHPDHLFEAAGPHDAQGYLPHLHKENFKKSAGRTSYRGSTVPANQQRKIEGSLHTLEPTGHNPFITHVPRIFAAKANLVARRTGLAQMWKFVASHGRAVAAGTKEAPARLDLHADERVFEVTPQGIHPLENQVTHESDKQAVGDVLSGRRQGHFIVLHKHVFDHIVEQLGSALPPRSAFGRGFDYTQGRLKWLTTQPLPSYHARNLMGDTFMHWEGEGSLRGMGAGTRGLRALHARGLSRRAPEAVTTRGVRTDAAYLKSERLLNAKIDLKKSGASTVGKEIKAAERHGAINSGFMGTELQYLLRHGESVGQGRVTRFATARENLPRFATYLDARRMGMSQAQAAAHSLKFHIDYGDLTRLERTVGRRAFPFWAFFARNTGIQIRTLLTRPGKVATLGKTLDQLSQTAGFKSYVDFLGPQQDYEQRGLPVPVKIGGKVFKEFLSLPATDLNQATANPNDLIQSLVNRVTFFKALYEIPRNYSFFFQGPIEGKKPLVAAPDFVGGFSPGLKKYLNIHKYLDKRSGKMIWGWPGKTDYFFRQLPETGTAVGLLTSHKGSRGQSGAQQGLSFLTGVKSVQNRPLENVINKLQAENSKIGNQLAALNQRGVHVANATPEYKALLKRQKLINNTLKSVSKKAGYKIPLGPAARPRKGGGAWSGAGGQSGSPWSGAGGQSGGWAGAGGK